MGGYEQKYLVCIYIPGKEGSDVTLAQKQFWQLLFPSSVNDSPFPAQHSPFCGKLSTVAP